jgi:tetraacyldisaccharide 4'-kinase
MNQKSYQKLVSGQSKGCLAGSLYIFLIMISKIYSVIIRLRNFCYDRHIFAIHHAKAIIISIGNVTTGGTGKTPLVAWLCNEIIKKEQNSPNNCRLAVLTRGYKTAKKNTDEPALLAENCSQADVVINPDRVKGAAAAMGKFSANMLIMDDGFQHRRLSRDLDIVTIDATCPFGYGRIIPAGLLREPLSSLKRANAIVITRCDQVSEAQLSKIEDKLQIIKPNILIARSIHQPVYIKTIKNRQIELDHFKNRKVFAFCGIGNPNAFINSLKNLDYEVVGSEIYDDHYSYSDKCMEEIKKQSQNLEAEIILTTQKDWTKVRLLNYAQELPLAYLVIEIKILTGEDKLRCLIEGVLEGKISKLIND